MATKTFGFGIRAFKKYPELVPLVTIVGAAVGGCCAFMGYALHSKPDVRVVKSRGAPHNDVGPTELRKLGRVNQKVEAIPELELLKKDISSYKY